MTWDFNERLAMSESHADDPFWEATYRRAFPNFANMMRNARDNRAQRDGVDRIVLLDNGRTLKIDEKSRDREYGGDMLLEYLSNDQTGAPGWIEKDLPIDYLAYAFVPSRRVYLFPWDLLRRAWARFGEEWKEAARAKARGYRLISARNAGYQTLSVIVPMDVLRGAVSRALIIEVSLDDVAEYEERRRVEAQLDLFGKREAAE